MAAPNTVRPIEPVNIPFIFLESNFAEATMRPITVVKPSIPVKSSSGFMSDNSFNATAMIPIPIAIFLIVPPTVIIAIIPLPVPNLATSKNALTSIPIVPARPAKPTAIFLGSILDINNNDPARIAIAAAILIKVPACKFF